MNHIKTLFALVFLLLASGLVLAEVPQLVTYQGQLTDSLGDPVSDGAYQIRFQIYDDPFAGAMFWSSGIRQINVLGGLFSYNLGDSSALPDDLFASDTALWLGIKVGADPEITPRTRMTAYGFAYHALRADSAGISATVYDNAITTAKILPGAVTGSQLSGNSVSSFSIANGQIAVEDINVAALPAAGSVNLTSISTSSTTPVTLDSVNIDVPGPGTLVLQFSGQVYIDADAVSTASVTTFGAIGICDTKDSETMCDGTYEAFYTQDADNGSLSNETESFSITRAISIGSAGTYTYYINANTGSSSYLLYLYQNPKLVAIFLPGSLNVTTTPRPPSDGDVNQR